MCLGVHLSLSLSLCVCKRVPVCELATRVRSKLVAKHFYEPSTGSSTVYVPTDLRTCPFLRTLKTDCLRTQKRALLFSQCTHDAYRVQERRFVDALVPVLVLMHWCVGVSVC